MSMHKIVLTKSATATADLYDSTLRFSRVRGNDLSTNIDLLCSRARRRPTSVYQITVPGEVRNRNQGYHLWVPMICLWEFGGGGGNSFSAEPRVCQIVGTPTGQPVPASSVHYVGPVTVPNRRQALSLAPIGAVFAVGHSVANSLCILVYRVDSTAAYPAAGLPPGLSERANYAAINASLLAMRVIAYDGVREWIEPDIAEGALDVDVERMMQAVAQKMAGPQTFPSYISALAPVRRPADPAVLSLYAIPPNAQIDQTRVCAEEFIATVRERLYEYREQRLATDRGRDHDIIPATLTITYLGDVEVGDTSPDEAEDAGDDEDDQGSEMHAAPIDGVAANALMVVDASTLTGVTSVARVSGSTDDRVSQFNTAIVGFDTASTGLDLALARSSDFGAGGDGITDDTVALQAAASAASQETDAMPESAIVDDEIVADSAVVVETVPELEFRFALPNAIGPDALSLVVVTTWRCQPGATLPDSFRDEMALCIETLDPSVLVARLKTPGQVMIRYMNSRL